MNKIKFYDVFVEGKLVESVEAKEVTSSELLNRYLGSKGLIVKTRLEPAPKYVVKKLCESGACPTITTTVPPVEVETEVEPEPEVAPEVEAIEEVEVEVEVEVEPIAEVEPEVIIAKKSKAKKVEVEAATEDEQL